MAKQTAFESEGSLDIDLIFELSPSLLHNEKKNLYPVQENVYISVQSAHIKIYFRPEDYMRVLDSL